MNWQDWLKRWNLSAVRLNLHFAQMEWQPQDKDRDAAWELYVELLTRVATQPLRDDAGDEATALKSVYSLFELTRETLKRQGRGCKEFTKIAIVVLNQVVRPFTARWHPVALSGGFQQQATREEFRRELAEIRATLRTYAAMLAEMAGVEDLTALEDLGGRQAVPPPGSSPAEAAVG